MGRVVVTINKVAFAVAPPVADLIGVEVFEMFPAEREVVVMASEVMRAVQRDEVGQGVDVLRLIKALGEQKPHAMVVVGWDR